MAKRLFIFTGAYPFGSAENFLETELSIISRYFDSIIIQPMTNTGVKKQRQTPKNVSVRPVLLPENRNFKLMLSILHLFEYRNLRQEIIKHKIFLSMKRLSNYLLAVTIKYCMTNCLPDLIDEINGRILYFYWGIGAAYCIPELKSLTGSRIVMRLHGGDLYECRSQGYLPLRKEVFQRADMICPVSEDGKRYLVERYPDTSTKIIVSRLGTKDSGMGKYMPTCGKMVIVSCASMIPMKRIRFLAELLGQQKEMAITWHHFGSGPEFSETFNYVSRYPSHIVGVFHGQVPNWQILDFYAKNHVDAFVSVSSSEGVPVSIMEAMSFGLPVIATNVGGTAEILFREGSVILESNFSSADFSEGLKKITYISLSGKLRREIRQHWGRFSSAETNYACFVENILYD